MEWRSATDVFHQLWDQALVAVTSAEEEATRLLGRVQVVASWSPDEAVRQAKEFSESLTIQRRDLETRIAAAVRATSERLRVPGRDDVARLSSRLETLARRVEVLTR